MNDYRLLSVLEDLEGIVPSGMSESLLVITLGVVALNDDVYDPPNLVSQFSIITFLPVLTYNGFLFEAQNHLIRSRVNSSSLPENKKFLNFFTFYKRPSFFFLRSH